MMQGARASARGFSLLELLVAFVIMAFSLAALYQASGGTVRSLAEVESQNQATMLAQSVLASRAIVPESGWNERGTSAGFQWQVSSSAYRSGYEPSRGPALQEVRVVVAWEDRRGPRRFELASLLPQVRPSAVVR